VGISVGEEGDTCTDPAFLMEMMELRETVDDLLQTLSANKSDTASSTADLARARAELKQCASQLHEQANAIHAELKTAFHGGSTLDIRSAAHPAPDTATARSLVTRLLYLERVRAAILDRI
jgi:DnaJ-domain-containing protein 1